MSTFIAKLQSQVGLKCGTVHEVSTNHLQELAMLSSNPDEFKNRYAVALDANCHNLAPMMEILHGIATNETTKRYLATKAVQQDSGGIQALKDKLLKEVKCF